MMKRMSVLILRIWRSSYITSIVVVIMGLAVPAMSQGQQQNLESLQKDVATCLTQAKAALGVRSGDQASQIDAYTANGRIFFNNPFVNQNPTFAFWKCLRLKGYQIDG